MKVHVVQLYLHCPDCSKYQPVSMGFRTICEHCGALIIGVDHYLTAADQKLAEMKQREH